MANVSAAPRISPGSHCADPCDHGLLKQEIAADLSERVRAETACDDGLVIVAIPTRSFAPGSRSMRVPLWPETSRCPRTGNTTAGPIGYRDGHGQRVLPGQPDCDMPG